MARKTIDLAYLVETVNNRNQHSVCDEKLRQGWNSLLESALHQCGQYHGFAYLRFNEVPPGFRPGIRCDADGLALEDYQERFRDCDDTRRHYYLPR